MTTKKTQQKEIRQITKGGVDHLRSHFEYIIDIYNTSLAQKYISTMDKTDVQSSIEVMQNLLKMVKQHFKIR